MPLADVEKKITRPSIDGIINKLHCPEQQRKPARPDQQLKMPERSCAKG